MGYELYREVKVWAPPSLTHREKLTAMVLADDANDKTRLTWNSVVDPEIMRQAMVKNDRDMRKILAKLQDEKLIESAGGGHNGRIAKYRFLHLNPDGCPGGSGCGCPLTLAVQNEPATEPVGGPERTGYAEPPGPEPVQKEPPTSGVAGSNRHRSRSESDRPTPSPSSSTSPLSVAEQVVRAADVVAEDEREIFISWLKDKHQIRGLGWWKTVTHDDLAEHAADWRAQLTAATAAPSIPPWCGACGDDNPAARLNPNFRQIDGQPCPDCHPDMQQRNAS
jgi:hypothetical protein